MLQVCCDPYCSTTVGEELEKLLVSYTPVRRDSLIAVLQDTQDLYGYLPEDAISRIAKHFDLPASKIFGVATFYNQFRLQPPGRNVISVCCGTACHVRGSKAVEQAFEAELGIKAGNTTRDGMFTLQSVACIGACGLAPVITVGEEAHGRMTAEAVADVVKSIRE